MEIFKKVYVVIAIPIAIFLLTASSFAAKNEAKPFSITLQLNWKYQFEFAGFIAAKEMGFYKKEGLKVKIKELKNPNSDVVDDVLAGKSDFGIVDSYLIYRAAKGAPVVALMPLFQHTPLALMVLKSSGIKKLKQLNGKKISISKRYLLVKDMLKSKGIKYIKYSPQYSIESLLKKKVDAVAIYISNEPFIAKEKGASIKLFKLSDYGFDGYGNILFTSKSFEERHPQITKKFLKATIEGWIYAFKHTAKMVNIIYNKYNTLKKSKKALLYEAATIKRLSGFDDGSFAKLDLFRVQRMASLLTQNHYNIQNLKNFIYK